MGIFALSSLSPPTEYDEKTRKKRWKEDSAVQLGEFYRAIACREPFDVRRYRERVQGLDRAKGYHLGNIMNAARLALVGGQGPRHL